MIHKRNRITSLFKTAITTQHEDSKEPLVPAGGYKILYQHKFWAVTLSRAVTQMQDVWVTDKLLTLKQSPDEQQLTESM